MTVIVFPDRQPTILAVYPQPDRCLVNCVTRDCIPRHEFGAQIIRQYRNRVKENGGESGIRTHDTRFARIRP